MYLDLCTPRDLFISGVFRVGRDDRGTPKLGKPTDNLGEHIWFLAWFSPRKYGFCLLVYLDFGSSWSSPPTWKKPEKERSRGVHKSRYQIFYPTPKTHKVTGIWKFRDSRFKCFEIFENSTKKNKIKIWNLKNLNFSKKN